MEGKHSSQRDVCFSIPRVRDRTQPLLWCRQNEELIEELSVPPEGKEPLRFATRFPQSYGTQFQLIFWKFWMSYWRNPQYNATRFLFAGILAFLIGTILWKVGHSK